jgi:CRP/FNR family transcriptional regulator, cyclic AMP receptor protein
MRNLEQPSFDPQAFLTTGGLVKSVAQYQPNSTIFSQGDPSDAIFYIQRGRVKLTVVSKQGKEAVIAILGPGDFLAEACLTGQKIHMGSATAIEPSSILKIGKHEMLRALKKESTLSSMFISYLLTRNMRIEQDLVDQLFNSSEKRLARTLLLLARYGNEGKPQEVILKINQETLAKMIGVTRERVNFFMNKFRKMGFIEYNGELRVHSSLLTVILND